jgi:quinol monooxygenase YgiN
MTVIVAGTFRVPPENLDALMTPLRAVVEATKAEDGCVTYSYGADVLEPGLIRVFEIWRDQACLAAHFQAAHMKAWQAERAALGFFDRQIKSYEISNESPL